MNYRPGNIPEPRGDSHLFNWAKELAHSLRIEFLAISKSTPTTSDQGIGVSGYGNKTEIASTGTVVKLKTPLANYIILFRCENLSGDGVGVSITNQNSNEFTATPLENAILYWTPIEV